MSLVPVVSAVSDLLTALASDGNWDKELDGPELDIGSTPERAAKALRELTSGHRKESLDELISTFKVFTPEVSERGPHPMVVQREIPFSSLCSHHILPFFGSVSIGYNPNDRIVGLSKLTRVVRHFSSRLTLQEKMTSDVADFLMEHLRPTGLIVVSRARHMCMEMRGVRSVGTETLTSALRGNAWTCKEEFYRLIGA